MELNPDAHSSLWLTGHNLNHVNYKGTESLTEQIQAAEFLPLFIKLFAANSVGKL